MRDNVRAFVRVAAESFSPRGPVYEFGSYQVAGQEACADLRGLFPGKPYVGCDLRPGLGVDRLEDLASLTLPDGAARTIVCVDTLEHVFEARRAVDEMIRVLAPGGLMLLAAPMDFRIHDYPGDYWRLTPSCIERLLEPLPATVIGWQGAEKYPHTVFGIGCKEPVGRDFAASAGRFIMAYQAWLRAAESRVDRRGKLKQRLFGWLHGKGERRRRRDQFLARFILHLPAGSPSKSDLLGLVAGQATESTRFASR